MWFDWSRGLTRLLQDGERDRQGVPDGEALKVGGFLRVNPVLFSMAHLYLARSIFIHGE